MADNSKDFAVVDRRASRAAEAAGAAPDAPVAADAQAAGPAAPPAAAPPVAAPPPAPPAEDEGLPSAAPAAEFEMDFTTFLMSLATSAFVHLGRARNPETGAVAANLPLARQTIDILGLLEDKTRGNLTDDEAILLQNLLFDLRLQYVEATSGAAGRPAAG
ncbi:MAG: DUF1844 domain-containing protein [Myxococcota bacterium]|jgi:hypothetical protein|nr:DUF1844 domain-containing protein [Myxococcota bacterium]